MDDSPYTRIIEALKKAQMSKADINRITGVPFGPLGHALEVLVLEGKVVKEGLRYKLAKEETYHALHATSRGTAGVWGRTPHAR